jgi:hypothetical protein
MCLTPLSTNKITALWWRSFLFDNETRVRVKHWPARRDCKTLTCVVFFSHMRQDNLMTAMLWDQLIAIPSLVFRTHVLQVLPVRKSINHTYVVETTLHHTLVFKYFFSSTSKSLRLVLFICTSKHGFGWSIDFDDLKIEIVLVSNATGFLYIYGNSRPVINKTSIDYRYASLFL